ncbi:UDP-N-acetylglucosamine transferase subunit ALG13 [Hungatella effluvii]|uniref:UDP-N-acetylglucosamine transferase subunit ALG13 n=1 Tax=Hungatella effluvii TaxID=1096246 RepID=A0A2V3Y3C2_9FIRM|nr:glycosyltransferase [Hungatella effluvii]PXX52504.1 UDP-N-acetylglucosamine transferase subunit ALG13 [Hungatella effluvii]
MIFVTVGTHEQQFNRLVQKIDELKRDGVIEEKVLIQTGYSTYEPEYCEWSQWIPYPKMLENVNKARIVVTHGGPSSFIMPLQVGKTPIVVPRQAKFDEHVNDHQVKFCNAVAERYGSIFVVENILKLGEAIMGYEDLFKAMPGKQESNNAKFNAELEKIVEEML